MLRTGRSGAPATGRDFLLEVSADSGHPPRCGLNDRSQRGRSQHPDPEKKLIRLTRNSEGGRSPGRLRSPCVVLGKQDPKRRADADGGLNLDTRIEQFGQALDDRQANAFAGFLV